MAVGRADGASPTLAWLATLIVFVVLVGAGFIAAFAFGVLDVTPEELAATGERSTRALHQGRSTDAPPPQAGSSWISSSGGPWCKASRQRW